MEYLTRIRRPESATTGRWFLKLYFLLVINLNENFRKNWRFWLPCLALACVTFQPLLAISGVYFPLNPRAIWAEAVIKGCIVGGLYEMYSFIGGLLLRIFSFGK